MSETIEKLVYFGDEIKAVGNTVKGYLVRFGNLNDTDLEGDYFTSSTDFGRPLRDGQKFALNLYYHHGADNVIGTKSIGTGFVKMDNVGLWYEAQIDMNDEYNKMIMELAKQGKLGFSSGAAGHLVERKSLGNSYEITRWNIAEASLTPRPAEYRNMATVKSLEEILEIKAEDVLICPNCGAEMKDGYCKMCDKPKKDDEEAPINPINVFENINSELIMEQLETIHEKLDDALVAWMNKEIEIDPNVVLEQHKQLVMSILGVNDGGMPMKLFAHRPLDIRDAEKTLREAMCLSRSEAKKLAGILWQNLCDASEVEEKIEEEIKSIEENVEIDDNSNNIKQMLLKKAMLDLIGD